MKLSEMSLTYRAAEAFCFAFQGTVKKKMARMFSAPRNSDALPRGFYRHFHVETHDLDGFPVYVIAGKDRISREKCVLFLHGGGGMARPTALHFSAAKKLARGCPCNVFFAYYPLAPEHNVVYALEWLEKLYKNLCRTVRPSDITLIGDSAGANLALSLTARVSDKPGTVVAISPAPGLEDGENRELRLAMETRDPLLNVAMNDQIKEHWASGVPLCSPDIDPLYIDFTGFHRLLFVYGSHELFYPHVRALLERLSHEGIPFSRIEEPLCHDFALCPFFPEGRSAMRKIISFINQEASL